MAAITQGSPPVLVNGEVTRCVDFADRGLNYGDGVFTTLAIAQGAPLFLSRHLERLRTDASRLGIPFPGESVLGEEARHLADLETQGVLKIMLTRGVGGRGYQPPKSVAGTRILSVHAKPSHPPELKEQGVKTRFCSIRLGLNPRLAGIKHLNRLEQILARAEWQDEDIREGLLLDYEGFLVEGVMSNLFLIHGGRLRTPLLDRCGVAGVMRGLVLEAARDMGIVSEQMRMRPEEALDADGIFLTNSIIGIWPVSALEEKAFLNHGLTQALARRIDAMTAEEIGRL